MTQQALKVYYDGAEIKLELERAIEVTLAKFGYKRRAGGYVPLDYERLLVFECEVDEDAGA